MLSEIAKLHKLLPRDALRDQRKVKPFLVPTKGKLLTVRFPDGGIIHQYKNGKFWVTETPIYYKQGDSFSPFYTSSPLEALLLISTNLSFIYSTEEPKENYTPINGSLIGLAEEYPTDWVKKLIECKGDLCSI